MINNKNSKGGGDGDGDDNEERDFMDAILSILDGDDGASEPSCCMVFMSLPNNAVLGLKSSPLLWFRHKLYYKYYTLI